eukprot:Tbor_TRINITY_DN5071_c0_g1::TRINITY_DN5071_c0_g1_i2::g.13999::m.13999
MTSSQDLTNLPTDSIANLPKQTTDRHGSSAAQVPSYANVTTGSSSSLAQNMSKPCALPPRPLSKEEFIGRYKKLVQAGLNQKDISATLLASQQEGNRDVEANHKGNINITTGGNSSVSHPLQHVGEHISGVPSPSLQQLQPERHKIEVDRVALLNRYRASSSAPPLPPVGGPIVPEQQNNVNRVDDVQPALQRGRAVINDHYERWLAGEIAGIVDVIVRAVIFGIVISPGDWSQVALIVVVSMILKVMSIIFGKVKLRVRDADHGAAGGVGVQNQNAQINDEREGARPNVWGEGAREAPPASKLYKIYYIIYKCIILFVVSLVPTFTIEGLENELLHDGIVRQHNPEPEPIPPAVPPLGPDNGNPMPVE